MSIMIVALVGAVILTGFIPVIGATQENIGDSVTYNNYMTQSNQYRYDYVDSLTLIATASESEDAQYDYVVNDQPIALINDYMISVLSDGYCMQIGNAGQFAYNVPTDPYTTNSNPNPTTYPTVTLTMANKEWTLMGGETEIASGTYSWLVTYVENGKYIAHNGAVTGAYCHKNPNDFIIYGSTYTSGDLDTYYAFGNGVMNCGVSDYTLTLNWGASKVDGTTDIYKVTSCNLTVTDGENSETFTPYRCLYLYEVNGHQSSGAMYDIYGLIPLIVAVGLLMFAITAILIRRV